MVRKWKINLHVDYWNTHTHNETKIQSSSDSKINADAYKQTIETSIVKIVKLKAGQHLLPNTALEESKIREKYNFLIDHNLNRLKKLLVLKEFDSKKISKTTNALERGIISSYNLIHSQTLWRRGTYFRYKR